MINGISLALGIYSPKQYINADKFFTVPDHGT